LVTLRYFSFLRVPGVEQDAVTELEVFAFGELDEIGAAFHGGEAGLGTAEGVGGHQAVAARVPAGGIGIGRVIEDRDAGDFAVDRAGVVAPGGFLAPDLAL